MCVGMFSLEYHMEYKSFCFCFQHSEQDRYPFFIRKNSVCSPGGIQVHDSLAYRSNGIALRSILFQLQVYVLAKDTQGCYLLQDTVVAKSSGAEGTHLKNAR